MRVLAVGDIHTKHWIFDAVERVIDNYDTVVFCGDYADDWNMSADESIRTWERLKALMDTHPNKIRAVLGNHDYIYVNRTPTAQSGYNPTTQVLLDMPANKQLKHWLTALPLTLRLDGVVYSHAGLDEQWDSKYTIESIWSNTSPIWTRPEWAEYRRSALTRKRIMQVVGHTPQQTVTELVPGVWGIDTFSTYEDGTPIGDRTTLEVTDGRVFTPVKLVR